MLRYKEMIPITVYMKSYVILTFTDTFLNEYCIMYTYTRLTLLV